MEWEIRNQAWEVVNVAAFSPTGKGAPVWLGAYDASAPDGSAHTFLRRVAAVVNTFRENDMDEDTAHLQEGM